jgi:hypothetical protein
MPLGSIAGHHRCLDITLRSIDPATVLQLHGGKISVSQMLYIMSPNVVF